MYGGKVTIVGEVGDRRIPTGRGGGEVGRLDRLEVGFDFGKGTVLVAAEGSEGDIAFGDGLADAVAALAGGTVKRDRSVALAVSIEVRPSNECDRAGATDLTVSSACFEVEEDRWNMPFLPRRGGVTFVLGGIAEGGCIQRRIAARASAGLSNQPGIPKVKR
jgi:hypothetical protein